MSETNVKTKELEEKASQGDAEAQFSLGRMYHLGDGVDQNYQEALRLYQEAADQGNPKAQNNLGVMYYNGEGVEQIYEKAVALYKQAADQGCIYSQSNLGHMYYNGKGVEQSYEKAVALFKQAAESGYAIAQSNLGDMYRIGKGVDRDLEKAAALYEQSAASGFAPAKIYLAQSYLLNWTGTKVDKVKAATIAISINVDDIPNDLRRETSVLMWEIYQSVMGDAVSKEGDFDLSEKFKMHTLGQQLLDKMARFNPEGVAAETDIDAEEEGFKRKPK